MEKIETGMKVLGGVGLAALGTSVLSNNQKVEEKALKISMLSLLGMAALFMFISND